MTSTNWTNSHHALLVGTPEQLKATWQGGHVKGSLLNINEEIETLLQLMEQCLPMGTQQWEYVETEFTSNHFKPLWNIASLWKKFTMLTKKKTLTGNPTYPHFARCAKKVFNTLVDKCNISYHGGICNLAENKTVLDSVEENNNNQGSEDEQECEAEVVVESPNMISIVDVVGSLPAHDSDTPANLNSLPRMVIRSILSSKKASRKNRQMKMARLIAVQHPNFLKWVNWICKSQRDTKRRVWNTVISRQSTTSSS